MKREKEIIVSLLVIFIFPIGIPIMWLTKTYLKDIRIVITIAFITAIVIGIGALILWTSSPGYIH